MSSSLVETVYISNKYCVENACKACGGVIRHEAECLMVNPLLQYAVEIVEDAGNLWIGDIILLNGLGVIWKNNCRTCKDTSK